MQEKGVAGGCTWPKLGWRTLRSSLENRSWECVCVWWCSSGALAFVVSLLIFLLPERSLQISEWKKTWDGHLVIVAATGAVQTPRPSPWRWLLLSPSSARRSRRPAWSGRFQEWRRGPAMDTAAQVDTRRVSIGVNSIQWLDGLFHGKSYSNGWFGGSMGYPYFREPPHIEIIYDFFATAHAYRYIVDIWWSGHGWMNSSDTHTPSKSYAGRRVDRPEVFDRSFARQMVLYESGPLLVSSDHLVTPAPNFGHPLTSRSTNSSYIIWHTYLLQVPWSLLWRRSGSKGDPNSTDHAPKVSWNIMRLYPHASIVVFLSSIYTQ